MLKRDPAKFTQAGLKPCPERNSLAHKLPVGHWIQRGKKQVTISLFHFIFEVLKDLWNVFLIVWFIISKIMF